MNGTTMMKFLKVNHSVQQLVNGGRRFVLPSGPCFPQFGPRTPVLKESIEPIASGTMADKAGARFRCVGHPSDIFDDHAETSADAAHEAGTWGERLKARWGATLDHFFHGASES